MKFNAETIQNVHWQYDIWSLIFIFSFRYLYEYWNVHGLPIFYVQLLFVLLLYRSGDDIMKDAIGIDYCGVRTWLFAICHIMTFLFYRMSSINSYLPFGIIIFTDLKFLSVLVKLLSRGLTHLLDFPY